jgi:hypothetical protein
MRSIWDVEDQILGQSWSLINLEGAHPASLDLALPRAFTDWEPSLD